MKVRKLIEQLQTIDPEREVVLSRDEEGNGFSSLEDVELMTYLDGEVYIECLTTRHLESGFTREDMCPSDDGVPAVVLWP
jgi:hypothetical protein